MSCTITGCRCYHKRMHEVIIWSYHNLMFLLKPLASLLITFFSFSLCDTLANSLTVCSYIPLFQSEKTNKLIKIPACKAVLAQEGRPASLAFTLFWGRAQAQRHRELQRSLMCTGLFWEWALRRDASTERDNRWQHLEPWKQPGLTILLRVSLFSSSPSMHLFVSALSWTELLSHKACV